MCFICFICFLCLVCLLCRGLRRSRPTALPSIGYRGFAVAPMTLRAPSRNIVVITVQINGCGNIRNGRAMRAPYGVRRCNRRLQIHLTVARMQPSVANESHSCSFPQLCRGSHRAPADILQTLTSPSPQTSLLEGGGPPAGGGRS